MKTKSIIFILFAILMIAISCSQEKEEHVSIIGVAESTNLSQDELKIFNNMLASDTLVLVQTNTDKIVAAAMNKDDFIKNENSPIGGAQRLMVTEPSGYRFIKR